MKSISFQFIRTVVLFVGGIIGIGYETLYEHSDRPTLLVLFAAMCGLPLFLNKDEHAKDAGLPLQPATAPPEVKP